MTLGGKGRYYAAAGDPKSDSNTIKITNTTKMTNRNKLTNKFDKNANISNNSFSKLLKGFLN